VTNVIQAAADLQRVCESEGWRFCFIGGLAVLRVLLLRAASGVGLDIALGGLAFEESAVARSSLFTFPPDVPLRTCSAEDLIVFKAFADRPKDWVGVDGVIIRQADTLDWTYVHTQLAPLAELKDDPRILDRLEARRRELDDRRD